MWFWQSDSPLSPTNAPLEPPGTEVALEDMNDAALMENLRVLTQTGDQG